MGAVLALASWALAVVLILILGLPIALLGRQRITWSVLRSALWAGLLAAVIIVLVSGLLTPLRSAVAAVVLLAVVAAAVIGTRLKRPTWDLRLGAGRVAWLVPAALGLLILALAVSVPFAITNYDSGLYHLGAISYAGDHATIPGLANLYQALGYSNSAFPIAAVLGNGPWGTQGYRLLNGLIIVIVCADLVSRWLAPRRTVGTYTLLIGAFAMLIPLVILADYWVTSPTSDSAVLMFTIASIAALADAIRSSRNWHRSAGIALITAGLAASMRPTMLVFIAVLVVVVGLLSWHRRAATGARRGIAWVACVGIGLVLLGLVQLVRDAVLSGWLLYPLSNLPLAVDWRAPDPVNTRLSTLGLARDPADYLQASHGWAWVPGWFARLPQQWETWAMLLLLALVVVLAVIAHRHGVRLRDRRLVLLLAPSVVAVIVWWVASPPSFRFIWGPLFGIPIALAGWYCFDLTRGRRSTRVSGAVVPVACAIVASAVVGIWGVSADWTTPRTPAAFTLGPISIPYSVVPVPVVVTKDVPLKPPLIVRMPTSTDQCWATYPLCTPYLESAITYRGTGIQEGFAAGPVQ